SPRRLVLRQSVEIAQQQRSTAIFRQPAQFLVERRAQLAPEQIVIRLRHGIDLSLCFMAAPPRAVGACAQGQTLGDSVQPTTEGVRATNPAGLTRQHEKRGLKNVFGILFVAQQTAAHAPDEWAMTPNKGRKGRFLTALDEALQELSVCLRDSGLS